MTVQLQVLSGQQAGRLWVARRFPFRVGRSADNDGPLDAPGVWDHHAQISLDRALGFCLNADAEASTLVNGQRTTACRLRNGDLLELGAAKLRFWLAPARQSRLRVLGALVWLLLAAVTAAQFALLRWLEW